MSDLEIKLSIKHVIIKKIFYELGKSINILFQSQDLKTKIA